MSAQCVHRVALLMAVGLATCAVHCWQFQTPGRIPPRCRQASVTPVSCAHGQYEGDRLLPHPDDCELFYYCVSAAAQPICRQCPAHLHFNPKLHVCDHPAVAGCQVLQSTEQPTETPVSEVTDSESQTATTDAPPTETTSTETTV